MNYSIIRMLMLGNALEYYDFFLCSFFISIISPLFFPTSDPLASLALGFSFAGVGFIARPFGALFFGYLGDKYGRKYALLRTLYLMAFSTFMIGLLPSYEVIGFYAPWLLTLLRLFQGFAIGGEVSGSAILGLELSLSKKGFCGALINSSAGIGAILATFFGLLFINDLMPNWTWRLLFCLGGSAAFIGIYLRQSLDDNIPENILKLPFLEVIQNQTLPLIKTIGIGFFLFSSFYIIVGCINPILHAQGLIHRTEMILMNGSIVVFGTMISPLLGMLSDKIGLQRLMFIGALGQMILAFPFFLMYSRGNISEIWIASVFLMLFAQAFIAPANAYLNTIFPSECRYTGVSFGTCVGIACSGYMTPIVCSQLLQISVWAPSLFLIGLSFIGILALKRHKGQPTFQPFPLNKFSQ